MLTERESKICSYHPKFSLTRMGNCNLLEYSQRQIDYMIVVVVRPSSYTFGYKQICRNAGLYTQ